MAAPGQVKGSRNYRSRPHQEFVKDGKWWYQNTAFQGKRGGPDNGGAKPSSSSLTSAPSVRKKAPRKKAPKWFDDAEMGVNLRDRGLVVTPNLYEKTRKERDEKYGPLSERPMSDEVAGFGSFTQKDSDNFAPRRDTEELNRKASLATSQLAEAYETLCDIQDSSFPRARTTDRMHALMGTRAAMRDQNFGKGVGTPIVGFERTDGPRYEGGPNFPFEDRSAAALQQLDVSSDGDLLLNNMATPSPKQGNRSHYGAVYKFRDGKWEQLAGPNDEIPKTSSLFSGSGKNRTLAPDPFAYGVMNTPEGKRMTDEDMVRTMYDPIPEECVDQAVRDLDILIARASANRKGKFKYPAKDTAEVSARLAAVKSLDALGPTGKVRDEVRRGLEAERRRHGVGAARRLGVGHPAVVAQNFNRAEVPLTRLSTPESEHTEHMEKLRRKRRKRGDAMEGSTAAPPTLTR